MQVWVVSIIPLTVCLFMAKFAMDTSGEKDEIYEHLFTLLRILTSKLLVHSSCISNCQRGLKIGKVDSMHTSMN